LNKREGATDNEAAFDLYAAPSTQVGDLYVAGRRRCAGIGARQWTQICPAVDVTAVRSAAM
jgi:hypothetical protein